MRLTARVALGNFRPPCAKQFVLPNAFVRQPTTAHTVSLPPPCFEHTPRATTGVVQPSILQIPRPPCLWHMSRLCLFTLQPPGYWHNFVECVLAIVRCALCERGTTQLVLYFKTPHPPNPMHRGMKSHAPGHGIFEAMIKEHIHTISSQQISSQTHTHTHCLHWLPT